MAKKQPSTLIQRLKNSLSRGKPSLKVVPMKDVLSRELMKDEEFATELLLSQTRQGKNIYQALKYLVHSFGADKFASKHGLAENEVISFLRNEAELDQQTITQYLKYLNCELEGKRVTRSKGKTKIKYVTRFLQIFS